MADSDLVKSDHRCLIRSVLRGVQGVLGYGLNSCERIFVSSVLSNPERSERCFRGY